MGAVEPLCCQWWLVEVMPRFASRASALSGCWWWCLFGGSAARPLCAQAMKALAWLRAYKQAEPISSGDGPCFVECCVSRRQAPAAGGGADVRSHWRRPAVQQGKGSQPCADNGSSSGVVALLDPGINVSDLDAQSESELSGGGGDDCICLPVAVASRSTSCPSASPAWWLLGHRMGPSADCVASIQIADAGVHGRLGGCQWPHCARTGRRCPRLAAERSASAGTQRRSRTARASSASRCTT